MKNEKVVATFTYVKSKYENLDANDFAYILFFADRYHLEKHGRSIYNEMYIRTPDGPIGLVSVILFNKLINSPCERKYLSESDIEALDMSIREWQNNRNGQENQFFKLTYENDDYDILNVDDIINTIPDNKDLKDYVHNYG